METGTIVRSRNASFSKSEKLGFVSPRPLIIPNRLPCEIQRHCESCRYVNRDYEESFKSKYEAGLKVLEEKNLLGKARLIPPIAAERKFEYRSTMKLAVRQGADGTLKIGLFRPGSHHVVEIAECPLHLRPLKKLLSALQSFLQTAQSNGQFHPWDEANHKGDLRYVVARCSHLTEDIQVSFVVPNEEKKIFFRDLVRDLRNSGLKIDSCYLNINPEPGNQIFGHSFVKLAGQDQLRVKLNEIPIQVSPGSFLQVNPWQADRIYNRIMQFAGNVERGELAWDLYCGVGPIALSLAKQGYRVWGVEENPQAIEDAIQNAQRNDFAPAQLNFSSGLLEEHLKEIPAWANTPSLIVLNPSRRGLADNVREKLSEVLASCKTLHSVLYLSCEVKTLARDLEGLLASGARLKQLEAFDMFPHTEKMEWLAVITPPQG